MSVRYGALVLLTGGISFDGYLTAICTRDCAWYAEIASRGYDVAPRPDSTASWPFFPVTPILLSALRGVTGFSWPLCGVVLGEAATAAAGLVARPLFESKRAYRLFCIFILFGPFAYAYGLGMSEPLFFLFSILVFAGLRCRQLAVVALAAMLLAATRVTGIFIVIPIVIDWLLVWRAQDVGRKGLDQWGHAVALVSALVGVGAFMVYLQLRTGDALAFVHVQAAWGRGPSNPLTNIVDGLLLRHHEGYGLTMSIFAVLGLAAALLLSLRRQVGMALFTTASVLLALSTGILSMVRFVAGLSPVTIVAADILSGSNRSFFLASVVAVILGILMSLLWAGGNPLLT